MKISDAIIALQAILAIRGDLTMVSGLNRSGYGELVESIGITTAYTYGNLGYGEPQEQVVELILSENSPYSSSIVQAC